MLLFIGQTRNGLTFNFIYDGNNLLAEQRNNNRVYYIYGVDGVVGFNYNGTTYLYRKNVQGDVTHIYTKDGTLVGQYVYDAWGNYKIETDVDGIATFNAFRYRSYYFDDETGLYYLQSRYYDAELGRFISADGIEYLDPETLGGLNLYSYCNNNPVMAIDPEGTTEWWQWLISSLQIVAGLVLIATGLGAGLGASLLLGGALGMVSNICGDQVGGGFGSIVNGAGAISTGVSLFSFGWVGAILGLGLILVGGATALFGANEIVSAAIGTNYVRDWMGADLYDGLYTGLNIASTVGTVVGRFGMRIAATKYGDSAPGTDKPYTKYVTDKNIYYYDGKGNISWSIHNYNSPINYTDKGLHWHLSFGRDGNHIYSYIIFLLEYIFRGK